MTRWLDEQEQRAWRSLALLTIRLPAALEAQLQRDSGISHFEYTVLTSLSEAPGRSLQMSDLAGLAGSSLSRLSHVASRLEARGWLQRSRVPGPGRRTALTLTDAGFAKIVDSAPGHVEAVRTYVVDALSERELAALRRAATKILTAVDPDDDCATA